MWGYFGLLVTGLLLSMLATLGLAWFMQYLIASGEMQLSESEPVRMLDFVRTRRAEVVQRKDRKPKRPEVGEAPEAPPIAQQAAADAGQQLAVSAPTLDEVDMAAGRGIIGFGQGAAEGDYLPIVKVAPLYPRRALERDITGTCLVRYTVTTSGTTRDVEAIESLCTDSMFIRPSVEAAKRFRYKPRVINGEAVEVHGVHNMFHFEKLSDAEPERQ